MRLLCVLLGHKTGPPNYRVAWCSRCQRYIDISTDRAVWKEP